MAFHPRRAWRALWSNETPGASDVAAYAPPPSSRELKAVNIAFVESVKASYPFYMIRVAGGVLYLTGMIIMAWNVWMTAISGRSVNVAIPAVKPAHA